MLMVTLRLLVAPFRVPVPIAIVAALAELMSRSVPSSTVLPLSARVPWVMVRMPLPLASLRIEFRVTVVAPAALFMVMLLKVSWGALIALAAPWSSTVLSPAVKLFAALKKSMPPLTVMVSEGRPAVAVNDPLTVRFVVVKSAPLREIVPTEVVSPVTLILLPAASRVPAAVNDRLPPTVSGLARSQVPVAVKERSW